MLSQSESSSSESLSNLWCLFLNTLFCSVPLRLLAILIQHCKSTTTQLKRKKDCWQYRLLKKVPHYRLQDFSPKPLTPIPNFWCRCFLGVTRSRQRKVSDTTLTHIFLKWPFIGLGMETSTSCSGPLVPDGRTAQFMPTQIISAASLVMLHRHWLKEG